MTNFVIIGVDKNIVQIYNDKNVELLSKNLINIFLKAYWCVSQPKKHYLILEVAIPSLDCYLLFVSFANSHSIVCTCKIKLDKRFSSS